MQDQEIVNQARSIMKSGKRIWEWVFRTQTHHLVELKDKKSGNSLSMAQYQLLLLVNKQQTTTISGLAAELGVSIPSASAMVDRLVERGVLTRRQARDDRRKVEVSLTEDAVQKVAETEAVLFDSFVALLEKVGQDTAGQWSEVLGRVKKCLPEKRVRSKE